MSTVHHAPHAFNAPLTSAEVNRPLGELDSAIAQVIATGSGASTTLTAQATAGTSGPFTVASTTSLLVGDTVFFGDPGGASESRVINTVPSGTTFTTTAVLTNTYAIGKPVSKSPIEIADARQGYSTLKANLAAKLGSVVDRGAGSFGITDTPSKRIPINIAAPMVGPDIVAAGGTSNVVALQLSPRFTGSLAGIGGADPGFVWGVDIFTTDGPAAADGDGIVDLTGLASEIALQSSAASQSVIRAMHANTSLWGATSGGTVNQIEGLRIGRPAFKNGALPANWTITNAYGLFVEDPGTVGTNRFAIYTDGGPSRFTGRLDVFGDLVQTGKMTLGGSAFPVGPAVNDVFYRTDRGLWYFWNGTNWLTVNLYGAFLGAAAANLTFPITVAGFPLIGPVPWNTVGARRDVYLEGWRVITNVNATNNATNYWSIGLERHPSATVLGSFTTAADSANTQVTHGGAIGALLGVTDLRLALNATKTGAPGSLDAPTYIEYRQVG